MEVTTEQDIPAADAAQTPPPDPSWLLHPDVPRMVKLAVKRKRRMFDAYNDIDEASLYADVMGELVKAKYDSSQSKPGTFAYRVAWARLMDISRRRTNEAHGKERMREDGVIRSTSTAGEMPLEEIAAGIYAAVKANFDRGGVPTRTPHCPRHRLDRTQRVSLFMLQERMGWSCRQAALALAADPEALRALGVTQPPSHQFFFRTRRAVTQLKKIFTPPETAPSAA